MVQSANGKKSILIVEDDEAISVAVVAVLADAGFETHSAENGKKALDLLGSGVVPNLILLDLMMPVMDGFQFREHQCHTSHADVPVVVMSADGNVNRKQEQTGAKAYIRKPFDIDHLVRV